MGRVLDHTLDVNVIEGTDVVVHLELLSSLLLGGTREGGRTHKGPSPVQIRSLSPLGEGMLEPFAKHVSLPTGAADFSLKEPEQISGSPAVEVSVIALFRRR